MTRKASRHAAYVEGWLNRTGKSLPPAKLVELFERAHVALWLRARRTLGDVTLMAIGDRVLVVASEKYPFFSNLKIGDAGIVFDEFRRQDAVERDRRLREGVGFVLTEFLTVLGNLTDEILTPALHAELSKVAIEAPKRDAKQAQVESVVQKSERAGAEGANS